MNARIGDALKKSDLGKALNAAFGAAIDIYTAGGPDGCFVFSTAPPETSSSPLCRTILDRALETIDAQFLSRLELEGKRLTSTPADLEAVAGQLGATLHSISLRAPAGWSPDRLRAFAAAAVRQALMVLGDSAA
jgi:hypothetical protein